MSDAKVRGRVHLIEDTKVFGQKGFRKRLVVLEQDNGRFTSFIPLDFVGDSCDTVDSLQVGDEVDVQYRLTGRKWQSPSNEVKYFLSAEATSFKLVGGNAKNANPGDVNDALSEASYDDGEDVPF